MKVSLINYLSAYGNQLTQAKNMKTKRSAIAEWPARRSVSVELKMLSYSYANNAHGSRVTPRVTFSNCDVLFR